MTTKTITLPSGATCKIRRTTGRDAISLGFIPDVLGDEKPSAVNDKAKELKARQEYAVKMNEIILCDCAGKIKRPDGTEFKVVRTPWDEIPDDDQTRVNVDLFAEDPDGACIVQQVLELSGFTTSAKEAVQPFPEEQESGGASGSGGAEVSQVTERVA